MIAAPSMVAGYTLAAYVMSSTFIDATTIPTARASTKVEEPHYRRSYVGRPASFSLGNCQVSSSQSEDTLLIGADRPEEAIVTTLAGFLDLKPGWDGEGAMAPTIGAVSDAIRFIRAAGARGLGLEPTLHVDGSVILELEDGEAGSLRFRGDNTVIYALASAGSGTLPFDGYSVPREIEPALTV